MSSRKAEMKQWKKAQWKLTAWSKKNLVMTCPIKSHNILTCWRWECIVEECSKAKKKTLWSNSQPEGTPSTRQVGKKLMSLCHLFEIRCHLPSKRNSWSESLYSRITYFLIERIHARHITSMKNNELWSNGCMHDQLTACIYDIYS